MADQPQTSGQSAGNRPPTAHKGHAPLIRKLKMRYPELGNTAIARRVGCTTGNVSAVLTRFLGDNSEDDLRQFQENKADIYDSMAQRFLESVTQEKLVKTPPASAVISAGILHDKAALIRGQATSNVNVRVLLEVADQLRSAGE